MKNLGDANLNYLNLINDYFLYTNENKLRLIYVF